MITSRRLLVALAFLASCLGNIDVDEATTTTDGPAGDGGMAGGPGAAGDGGDGDCQTPPDGWCNEADDCACAACQVAASCTDGGCMANGYCDLIFEDSCVCSDCDWSPECLSPSAGPNCTDDGNCDRAAEGCACADCEAETTCQDNHAACIGGLPDGLCEVGVESCSCSDCLGDLLCLCGSPAECYFDKPCVCNSCWGDVYCDDPLDCFDDASCDIDFESCVCADCAGEPVCAGFP